MIRHLSVVFCFLFLVTLAACTQPSHIPAPWELPGAVIGTTIDNAVYESRRKEVKSFIRANYSQLKEDTAVGEGAVISKLFKLARVRVRQRELLDELQSAESGYFSDTELSQQDLEKLVVAVMVYSD